MNYIHNYENPMQQCEKLMNANFDKLKFLKDQTPITSSSSESSAVENAYRTIKKYLDEAKRNVASLKSRYSKLTKRYEGLLETNFANEFLNYLKRQEALRLKFLEIIYECKRINSCIDEILYVSCVEAEKRNSFQNPSERLRGCDTHNNQSKQNEASATANPRKTVTCTCNVCGKSFYSKATMERHAILHKGLKPFTCAECGGSFCRKDTMKNHILLVHFPFGDKRRHSPNLNLTRFNCTVCGRIFGTEHSRIRHEQSWRDSNRVKESRKNPILTIRIGFESRFPKSKESGNAGIRFPFIENCTASIPCDSLQMFFTC
ncbi:zinc finger protein 761-like isoform X1 [Planococcus citri]|uniref:zinc finger protein 761-like isoform X1 n=1 Tax=Planococcus citri TaxID=170843 RepID=UPI0031F9F2C3